MAAALDLDRYLRIPRLADLDLSPDGESLVFTAARPARDGKRFVRDLWRVAVAGGPPARLTVGDSTDHSPRFLADGSILFLSERKDPEAAAEGEGADASPIGDDPVSQLWLLPVRGEPRALTHRSASLAGFAPARDGASAGAPGGCAAGVGVLFSASVHPGARDPGADRAIERERKKSGLSGFVFDGLPIRFWDRFYGPRYVHLFHAPSLDQADRARDLSPEATIEHDDLGFDLSPDGRHAVAVERGRDDDGRFFENLRLHDLGAGSSRLITSGRDSFAQPRFSFDGRAIACVFHENLPGKTGRQWLVEVDLEPLASGREPSLRPLTRDLDLWPETPVWGPDRGLYFLADERGQHAVFRLDLDRLAVTRLTRRGSHASVVASPGGGPVFAIGARFDQPPEVVAIDPGRADQEPRRLTHLTAEALGGVELQEPEALVAKSADGREVHSWLLRPGKASGNAAGSGKAALLLWVHGGPLGAWDDGWHWRWNPQLFAARGYAVLLANPRISTGYGQAFVEEGFGRWGGEPYQDLMAAVDQAAQLPGIDASRLGAMGGSYGGYMANWIAGHTSRFRCIVSHAGLWQLTGFHGTTDLGPEWEREFGGDPYRHPEVYERWSPHQAVRDIKTPMLVIHGEKDYRVPVSEAYQLFTALQRLAVPSRLLYFPDENHWILRPPNIRLWHETIWAWLERWLGNEAAPGAKA